jgi:hypothetical protein
MSNTSREDAPMDIPESCTICYNAIAPFMSVLLYCECAISICKDCAVRQLAAQPKTYHEGLQCPCCRISSANIKGVAAAQVAEDSLILSALQHWKIRSSRNMDLTTVLLGKSIILRK